MIRYIQQQDHILDYGSLQLIWKDQSEVLFYRSKRRFGTRDVGIVYKGKDAKKNEIAMKRIDGDIHPRILTQDLNRLMKLDRQHVMKILDVEKNKNIVWMMMPFCELGDLKSLLQNKTCST